MSKSKRQRVREAKRILMRDRTRPVGWSVTIIGLGNTGSQVVPLVARMPGVRRMVVVDPERYESKNLRGQDVLPSEVGRWKAVVQAEHAEQINPSVRAEAIVARAEDVPPGRLRADVILACVDSKESRRVVNQAAWRLGVPWVDTGVEAGFGLFARVAAYVPGPDSACLECAWGEEQYAALEQRHPCGGGGAVRPTNAAASLGALAAAMQAVECEKILAGDMQHALAGRQVLIDARHHTHYVTAFRRNERCRFDHRTLEIEPFDGVCSALTLGSVLGRRPWRGRRKTSYSLCVEGAAFVREVLCQACGRQRATLRLAGRLRRADTSCAKCGGRAVPVGFSTCDRLAFGGADVRMLGAPLSRLGLRRGDVFSIRAEKGVEKTYEIMGRGL